MFIDLYLGKLSVYILTVCVFLWLGQPSGLPALSGPDRAGGRLPPQVLAVSPPNYSSSSSLLVVSVLHQQLYNFRPLPANAAETCVSGRAATCSVAQFCWLCNPQQLSMTSRISMDRLHAATSLFMTTCWIDSLETSSLILYRKLVWSLKYIYMYHILAFDVIPHVPIASVDESHWVNPTQNGWPVRPIHNHL